MLFGFNNELDTVLTEEYLQGGAFDVLWRNRDIAIRPDGSFYLITNDRMDARIRWVHPDVGTSKPETAVDANALRAWPNPASDRITVLVPDATANTLVELLDVQGRRVALAPQRMGERFLFDVQTLSIGVYAVRVSDGRILRVVKR